MEFYNCLSKDLIELFAGPVSPFYPYNNPVKLVKPISPISFMSPLELLSFWFSTNCYTMLRLESKEEVVRIQSVAEL